MNRFLAWLQLVDGGGFVRTQISRQPGVAMSITSIPRSWHVL